MSSPEFSDLTQRDLRLVNRMTGRLVETEDLDSLGREFVDEMAAILPADCMVWNRWTPDMDEILGFESNDPGFQEGLARYEEPLNATIGHHPVIAGGGTEKTWLRPQRISDYQSYNAFKANPLFHEVYRHLDSHHQIAYSAARLDGSVLLLSWNLKHRDFTDREVQLLHLAGLRVGALSRRLDEARRLDAMWRSLSVLLAQVPEFDTSTAAPLLLKRNDGRILAGLIRGQSRLEIASRLQWRRDTLDHYLADLRERAGYDSMPQFLHALAALKPRP